MPINQLIEKIKNQPESISFTEVIETIDEYYEYTPREFSNGLNESLITNAAGTNEGSCKIFAFAQLNQLNQNETLACFGDYYRKDVLENPDTDDHANIRTFMIYGWDGIKFEAPALVARLH